MASYSWGCSICSRFVISQSTVETVTYDDWVTASGTISRTVRRLVTPAVQVRGDQILVGVTSLHDDAA